MSGSRTTDVLIIGGGINGCCTAYHLAKAGRRVTVLEKHSVAYEASGRNIGAVRIQMRHPLEVPIAVEAIRRWRTLDEELGVATEFRTTGNLLATYREEEVDGLLEEAERQRTLGIDLGVVERRDLKELVPAISDEIVAGLYSPDDGLANPQRATIAFATAARRVGAEILTGVKVDSIRVEGRKVQGVRTADGDFSAPVVLNAAGVGAPALGRSVGLDIPVVPWRYQPLVTGRAPRVTNCYLRCTGPRIGFGQQANGTIVWGLGPAEEVGFESATTQERVSRAMRQLVRLIPALRGIQFVRSWTGWFEISPDDLPIMGPVEGIEGLILATGFSGHGFALGPATGFLLSELILTGKTSIPIYGFRPSRFQEPGYKKEEPTGKLAKLWTLTAAGAE